MENEELFFFFSSRERTELGGVVGLGVRSM